jgi:hypothetical protein
MNACFCCSAADKINKKPKGKPANMDGKVEEEEDDSDEEGSDVAAVQKEDGQAVHGGKPHHRWTLTSQLPALVSP